MNTITRSYFPLTHPYPVDVAQDWYHAEFAGPIAWSVRASITVPAGELWILREFSIQNRRPLGTNRTHAGITLDRGAGEVMIIHDNNKVAAVGAEVDVTFPLPSFILAPAGSILRAYAFTDLAVPREFRFMVLIDRITL